MSFPTPTAAGRKRKADDDDLRLDPSASLNPPTSTSHDRVMSSPSPNLASSTLPRPLKRPRPAFAGGRSLALPRLLETLDADALRSTLRSLVEQHPPLALAIEKAAPRPTVSASLDVLHRYEQRLRDAFPFGGHRGSDYAFHRVRPALMALRDALADFTPHFLPPSPEASVEGALEWLDGATAVVARMPEWNAWANALVKTEAYEDIARAWVLVLREAAKRAGGMMLAYEGWDRKIRKHDADSAGKLQEVVAVLDEILAWTGSGIAGPATQQAGGRADERSSIRQELLSGTYGASVPVRVGPW